MSNTENTPATADEPKVETLKEEGERIIRENQEKMFGRWLAQHGPVTPEANDDDPTATEMAVDVAEKALRPFGSSALAGLRAGGAFISALKGADEKAKARAASRASLAREKAIAKRGALLRADIPESKLAAAKAAEAFLYDLGLEVAKRSDLF